MRYSLEAKAFIFTELSCNKNRLVSLKNRAGDEIVEKSIDHSLSQKLFMSLAQGHAFK